MAKNSILVWRPIDGPVTVRFYDDNVQAKMDFRTYPVRDGSIELWNSTRGRCKVRRHETPVVTEAAPSPALSIDTPQEEDADNLETRIKRKYTRRI
jgi:hypothetical protein